MPNDSKVTLLLIAGGMILILAAIAAVGYLYHVHASTFILPPERPGLDNFAMFLIGVGLPAAVGAVIGGILLIIGVKQHTNGPR